MTERKFAYSSAFIRDRSDSDSDSETDTELLHDVTTVLVRATVLPNLVNGLICPDCGAALLVIRVIDCRLLIVAMEMYCTGCDNVVNSTLSSDRIKRSTSGDVPFFTVRQVITGAIDMGVGHHGLVKLCCFLDITRHLQGIHVPSVMPTRLW